MKCNWCDRDATHEVVIRPSRGMKKEVASACCGIHGKQFRERGLTVHSYVTKGTS